MPINENYGSRLPNAGTSAQIPVSDPAKERSRTDELSNLIYESDDVNRIMKGLSPQMQEHNQAMKRQVDALEKIASNAESMASSALKQSEIARDNSISSNKHSKFAAVMSILALLASILSAIAQILLG